MTQFAVKYDDQLVVDHSWECVADVVATYLSGSFSEGGRVTGVLVSRERDGDEWTEVRTVSEFSDCQLYQGDALEVLRGLPDGCADSVVTDPPYKISQEYSANADPDNLLAVASLLQVAPEMYRVAKPGALCAVYYDTRILPLALAAMSGAGWKYLRALTFYRRWGNAHKLAGWMSTSDFILIYAKPGEPYKFGSEWRHDVYVRDKKEPVSFGHPAQKPQDDVSHLVRQITPEGGTVLDPYMGSGTTGVAAIESGRKFIGVEKTEHFYGVAVDRIHEVHPALGGAA